MRSTSLPSSLLRNSPFSFSSFKAFHCLGLCEAVRMIPPLAPSMVTASSVVGVEARSMSTTSQPIPIRVPTTTFFTISPEMRASRPTTILLLFTVHVLRISVAYAEVNFTMSSGLSPSPATPPMVPRIPEIDLIRVIDKWIYMYRLVPDLVFPNVIVTGIDAADCIRLSHLGGYNQLDVCPVAHIRQGDQPAGRY